MRWYRSLLSFSMVFGAIGVVVPLVLILRWRIFQQPFGTIEGWLWPSSIMLMALEASGTTRSTVVYVYALVIAENALLYSIIGAIMWFVVYILVQSLQRQAPK